MKKQHLLLYLYLISGIIITQHLSAQNTLQKEFRGVWVATVENIDWPSQKNLSAAEQQKEFIKLLDHFKALHFNAIVFQVRPSADAFYLSKYEPWSAYLNGTSNKKPSPYYDPLAFMIEETHKRGMEFHAWLNPYRAMVNFKEYHANPYKLFYEKPEWFVNYGKNKYFNPGLPEVRQYTNNIVADIVQNYDIDAIHFDDYFYPYKIAKEIFPDQEAFKVHGGDFYPNRIDDWRRHNVNLIIKELRATIKSIKPWVQFGISPFGVWRNKDKDAKGSDTQAGQTNYDDLYADILFWLENKWLDYIVPQAYWHIGFDKADYSKIIEWWHLNNHNTNLYIGQATYRLNSNKSKQWKAKSPTEIEKQLELNYSFSNIKGSVFFSAKSFFSNPLNINNRLKNHYYQHPVLPPSITMSGLPPEPVSELAFVKKKSKSIEIQWQSLPENKEKEAVKFIVFIFKKGESVNINSSANIIGLTGVHHFYISKKDLKKGDVIVVQSVNRNNQVSLPKFLKY